MFFLLFQLLVFGLSILGLVSLFPKKIARFLSLALAIPFTLQAAAVYANGRFIDARFLSHFSLESLWQTRNVFFIEFGLFLLTYFLFLLIVWRANAMIRKKGLNRGWIVLVFILGGAFTFLPNGMAYSFGYYLKTILPAGEKVAFDDALMGLGINPDEYTHQQEIEARPGKNIIVISVESLEKGFLQEPFTEVTPYLQELAEKNTMIDMSQLKGSDWTAASVYSSISGMPTFFRSPGNDIFQQAEESDITGLTSVLQSAGYSLEYIIGNPDFAGMGDMLRAFGFTVKSETDFPGQHKTTPWGLHDYDLFNIAKQEVVKLKNRQRPFALFLSTVSTHPPKGIMDDRVLDMVEDQGSTMKTMIKAVDYMLNDFVSFLEDQGLLESTVFYIMPDHQLIGNVSQIARELSQPRSLYLLSNASEDLLSLRPGEELFQIMLPKLILEGAEIQHNARFLYDYIGDEPIPDYLSQNFRELEDINEAAWQLGGFASGFEIVETDSGDVYLKANNDGKQLSLGSLSEDSAALFTFDRKLRLLSQNIYGLTQAYQKQGSHRELNLIVFRNKNGLFAHFKKTDLAGISKAHHQQIAFSVKDLEVLKEWPVPIDYYDNQYDDLVLTYDQKLWGNDKTRLIAHAGGRIDGNYYTNSLEALDLFYAKGFRWFELDILKTIDGSYVAAHDWQGWMDMTGYTGAIPPTENEFKSLKLHGEYSPLNMQDINQWFSEHTDAILVTDKINEPIGFSTRFAAKDRLVMELFSWDSARVATGLGLKDVFLSEPLLYEIEGDKLEYLQKNGITSLAMSRKSVAEHRDYYLFLKSKGIKVYLFHLNEEPGINELYVLQNELFAAFGMYADDWDFGQFASSP